MDHSHCNKNRLLNHRNISLNEKLNKVDIVGLTINLLFQLIQNSAFTPNIKLINSTFYPLDFYEEGNLMQLSFYEIHEHRIELNLIKAITCKHEIVKMKIKENNKECDTKSLNKSLNRIFLKEFNPIRNKNVPSSIQNKNVKPPTKKKIEISQSPPFNLPKKNLQSPKGNLIHCGGNTINSPKSKNIIYVPNYIKNGYDFKKKQLLKHYASKKVSQSTINNDEETTFSYNSKKDLRINENRINLELKHQKEYSFGFNEEIENKYNNVFCSEVKAYVCNSKTNKESSFKEQDYNNPGLINNIENKMRHLFQKQND